MTDQILHAPLGITFLRSTTTTVVERTATGQSATAVEHMAYFAVEPGTIADQIAAPYSGGKLFRPLFMSAIWDIGQLKVVKVTGRRVLKDGKLDISSWPDISREVAWTHWGSGTLDRSRLPEPLAARLAVYEDNVSMYVTEAKTS